MGYFGGQKIEFTDFTTTVIAAIVPVLIHLCRYFAGKLYPTGFTNIFPPNFPINVSLHRQILFNQCGNKICSLFLLTKFNISG